MNLQMEATLVKESMNIEWVAEVHIFKLFFVPLVIFVLLIDWVS